jgi:hypothetical protein
VQERPLPGQIPAAVFWARCSDKLGGLRIWHVWAARPVSPSTRCTAFRSLLRNRCRSTIGTPTSRDRESAVNRKPRNANGGAIGDEWGHSAHLAQVTVALPPQACSQSPVSPNGGIPPGNASGIWVHCQKCDHDRQKRSGWDRGCPCPDCDGGPADIVVIPKPAK